MGGFEGSYTGAGCQSDHGDGEPVSATCSRLTSTRVLYSEVKATATLTCDPQFKAIFCESMTCLGTVAPVCTFTPAPPVISGDATSCTAKAGSGVSHMSLVCAKGSPNWCLNFGAGVMGVSRLNFYADAACTLPLDFSSQAGGSVTGTVGRVGGFGPPSLFTSLPWCPGIRQVDLSKTSLADITACGSICADFSIVADAGIQDVQCITATIQGTPSAVFSRGALTASNLATAQLGSLQQQPLLRGNTRSPTYYRLAIAFPAKILPVVDLGILDSSFTAMCWVMRAGTFQNGRDEGVFGSELPITRLPRNTFQFGIRKEVPFVGFYDNDCLGTIPIPWSTWTHLAVVYDVRKQTQSLYVDGQLDTVCTQRSSFLGFMDIQIGQFLGSNFPSSGILWNPAFWGAAMSQADVRQLATRQRTRIDETFIPLPVWQYRYGAGELSSSGPDAVLPLNLGTLADLGITGSFTLSLWYTIPASAFSVNQNLLSAVLPNTVLKISIRADAFLQMEFNGAICTSTSIIQTSSTTPPTFSHAAFVYNAASMTMSMYSMTTLIGNCSALAPPPVQSPVTGYCVVSGTAMVLATTDLSQAVATLQAAFSTSKLICRMVNGLVELDPTLTDRQGIASRATWQDLNDLRRMQGICQSDSLCASDFSGTTSLILGDTSKPTTQTMREVYLFNAPLTPSYISDYLLSRPAPVSFYFSGGTYGLAGSSSNIAGPGVDAVFAEGVGVSIAFTGSWGSLPLSPNSIIFDCGTSSSDFVRIFSGATNGNAISVALFRNTSQVAQLNSPNAVLSLPGSHRYLVTIGRAVGITVWRDGSLIFVDRSQLFTPAAVTRNSCLVGGSSNVSFRPVQGLVTDVYLFAGELPWASVVPLMSQSATTTTTGSPAVASTLIPTWFRRSPVATYPQVVRGGVELGLYGTSFSVMTWVMRGAAAATPDFSTILGMSSTRENSDNNLQTLHLGVKNDKAYFGFFGASCCDCAGNVIIPREVWTHIAFVYDVIYQTQSIYVNGTLDTVCQNRQPLKQPSTGENRLVYVGNWNTSTSPSPYYFVGEIRNLYIYPSALTQANLNDQSVPGITMPIFSLRAALCSVGYTWAGDAYASVGPKTYPKFAVRSVSNTTTVQKNILGHPLDLGLVNSSFTISAWIYMTTLPVGSVSILGTASAPTRRENQVLHLLVRSGRFYFGTYANDCAGSVALQPLQWIHVAFVYDFAQRIQYIYVNGRLDVNCSNRGPFSGNLNIALGGYPWSDIAPFRGLINELRGYSEAFSAARVPILAQADFQFGQSKFPWLAANQSVARTASGGDDGTDALGLIVGLSVGGVVLGGILAIIIMIKMGVIPCCCPCQTSSSAPAVTPYSTAAYPEVVGARAVSDETDHPPLEAWCLDTIPPYWTHGSSNLGTEGDVSPATVAFDQMVYVEKADTKTFQDMLDKCYKPIVTQDRLCPKQTCAKTKGGCPCVQVGGDPGLPEGYQIRRVVRVEDSNMWMRYQQAFKRLKEKRSGQQLRTFDPPLLTSAVKHEEVLAGLDTSINECYLWHGTNIRTGLRIAQHDFDLKHAGTGAGAMYGTGVYFAESCTKADEYAKDDPGGYYDGVFGMLLCRVCMGRMYYTTERAPEAEDKVQSGEYDSTLGDRAKSVGTFRELVVYNVDQVYPEFLVIYSRKLRLSPPLPSFEEDPFHMELPVYWHNVDKNPDTESFRERFRVNDRTLRLLQTMVDGTCSKGCPPRILDAFRIEDSEMWTRYVGYKTKLRKRLEEAGKDECAKPNELEGKNNSGAVLTESLLESKVKPEEAISIENMEVDLNEMLLWHGTSKSSADSITDKGFKIGTVLNGARFGRGTYLAEDLSKSLQYCTTEAGRVYVLLCRATLGELFYTMQNWEEDCHEKALAMKKDSVLANPNGVGPREFIVLQEVQVYPEYVLEMMTCQS